jgi:hypothetical protein
MKKTHRTSSAAKPFWLIVAADVEIEIACIQAVTAEVALARVPTIRHLLPRHLRHAAHYQVLVAEEVKELEMIRTARFTEEFFKVFHEAMEITYSA